MWKNQLNWIQSNSEQNDWKLKVGVVHGERKNESIRIDLINYSKGSLCVKVTHILRFKLYTAHTNCLRIDDKKYFSFWLNLMISLPFCQIPGKATFFPNSGDKRFFFHQYIFGFSKINASKSWERKNLDSDCFRYLFR